jgi:hypothetical protein
MEYTYEQIKALAKETGKRVTDLIALAAQNDPFYQGTPTTLALAEWFAEFYHNSFSYGTRAHIRRCHYLIVSLGLTLPNGRPYENTEECWNTLLLASKAARYLKLVDIYSFDDRKNDEPVDYSQSSGYAPAIGIYDYLYDSDLKVPDFPDYPTFSLSDYEARQAYHLEVWCEKTTMNDILLPLCQRYNMVLQTGAGELSITATANLARRLEASGKPARIFYVSDFDPAGQSMPVAVARKLEYFVRNEQLDADIRLFPMVLTAEQVARYRLPRTPIKETERRREHFEQHHGTGAVELDALEALYPGELARVLTAAIERYYDTALAEQARERRAELERDLRAIRRDVIDAHIDAINDVRDELEGIRRDFGPRMATYSEHLQSLWQAISADLDEAKPDLADYPVPEGKPGEEIGEGLYNSERDYMAQIEVYKAFQGK